MASATNGKKNRNWIMRYWGKTTAAALAIVAFLGWYDSVRNKGYMFLCDVAGLVGAKEILPICHGRVIAPGKSDWYTQLEYLKERKDQLKPKRLEQLHQLELHFEERAFDMLLSANTIILL